MKRKYSVKSCHYKKGEAKKAQKRLHDKGMTAKIVKKTVKVGARTRTKYCVESAGKRK
jgi:hypothetical protein